MHRGESWYADVPEDKRRPVIVLTDSSVLPQLTTILVAPVTTRIRDIPDEVRVSAPLRSGVADLDNITPLSKATLVECVGRSSRPRCAPYRTDHPATSAP